MALPITDSQNSKVYIVAEGTAVTDPTEITTAISGGDQIGCLQSLGSISTTRSVQEYSCLSSDETAKSFGSLSLGNIAMELLFDALDSAGQLALRTMYSTNARMTFIVELNDNAGVSPTYITFDGGISSEDIAVAKDSAVMYNVTIEIASAPVVVLATAS